MILDDDDDNSETPNEVVCINNVGLTGSIIIVFRAIISSRKLFYSMKYCFLLSFSFSSQPENREGFFGISKFLSVLVFTRNITNLSNRSADHHVKEMARYSSGEATGS
jgi:hypothetical protein